MQRFALGRNKLSRFSSSGMARYSRRILFSEESSTQRLRIMKRSKTTLLLR